MTSASIELPPFSGLDGRTQKAGFVLPGPCHNHDARIFSWCACSYWRFQPRVQADPIFTPSDVTIVCAKVPSGFCMRWQSIWRDKSRRVVKYFASLGQITGFAALLACRTESAANRRQTEQIDACRLRKTARFAASTGKSSCRWQSRWIQGISEVELGKCAASPIPGLMAA